MDIQELRIGDKVEYLGKIATIRAIYNSGNVEFKSNDNDGRIVYISVPVENVQPIVLTDKIIKKIGFTQVSKYLGDGIDYRFSNDNECRIWHTLLNNSSYEYNIHTNESSKNIKYLHQLQHELFDAGIELKIEL